MLASGSTLGPYELDARLGSGGMGDVYRARDTRLGRIVAIKVLSPRVSHDENVRKRFLREARAISSLNHPHICALYDIGRDNGSDFLVMEYLEGETLAQRLARERLHYDEALRYAIEIASALERAHRQGVVHRDLKPANIMVTRTGAKLLDFGLARLAASGEESSIGPLTGDDSMIGTIEYMSPEQLKGEAADARSDIFSFGILMHEMVTGARPFEGANRASVMGSILFAPYVSGHSQEVMFPDSVDRLIGACLEKNPDDRIQTARDLRRELEWIRDGTSAHVSRRKRKVPKAVILSMLLGAAVLAGAALATLLVRQRSVTFREIRFDLTSPVDGEQIDWPILTRDGSRIAFLSTTDSGTQSLWVRDLSSATAKKLALPRGVMQPIWSPAGDAIAFFASDKLEIFDLSDKTAKPILPVVAPRGLSWGSNGDILYVPHITSGIWCTDRHGRTPREVTKLDPEQQDVTHRWPEFLPDGKRFVFVIRSRNLQRSGLYLGVLTSKEYKKIGTIQSRVVVNRAGQMLYMMNGSLYRQDFDLRKGELEGEPHLIADNLGVDLKVTGAAAISIANNGSYSFARKIDTRTRLQWIDRNGQLGAIVAGAGYYVNPALSPDEKTLAVSRIDPETGRNSIWLLDLAGHAFRPLVVDDSNADGPVWDLRGQSIFYSSDRRGEYDVYQKSVNGVGADRLVLASGPFAQVNAVTAIGAVVHVVGDDAQEPAFWLLPSTGAPRRKLAEAIEGTADVTRDGAWLAAVRRSAETAAYEVYVQSIAEPDRLRQISIGGGGQPTWRADGQELYYIHTDRTLIAVPFHGGEPQAEKRLFHVDVPDLFYANRDYVVTADGQRFIVGVPVSSKQMGTVTVVVPVPTG